MVRKLVVGLVVAVVLGFGAVRASEGNGSVKDLNKLLVEYKALLADKVDKRIARTPDVFVGGLAYDAIEEYDRAVMFANKYSRLAPKFGIIYIENRISSLKDKLEN